MVLGEVYCGGEGVSGGEDEGAGECSGEEAEGSLAVKEDGGEGDGGGPEGG